MRLLQLKDDDTFNLVEYFDKNVPPYAILSHTWGADHEELVLRDLISGHGTDRDGYRKLLFCGKQAAKDDLKFFWVDTVCIDKTSSAELQEAITSMFRWYQTAAKCYAYLSDVSIHDVKDDSQSFRKSRWFKRGWTLQELIAPTSVEFFSLEGDRIGDRISMMEDIHDITKIPVEALQGYPLASFSTNERMSWAKGRETTREEDAAYSLLGIFDVYMSPRYGEGRDNAIARLERKISKFGGNHSSISTPPRALPEQIGQNLGPFSFLFKTPGLGSAEDFSAFPSVQKTRAQTTDVTSAAALSNTNIWQARGQSVAQIVKELSILVQDNDLKPGQRGDNKVNDELFDDIWSALEENVRNENTSLDNGDIRPRGKSGLQSDSSIKRSAFPFQWAELEAYVDDVKAREQTQVAGMQEVFRLLISLKDQEKTKSQVAINDWLDVSKFNDHYSVTQHYEKQIASRLKGTCDWIFSHDAYNTWILDELHCDTAKILWIHAPAGHGKSVLCARVVEHLKSEQSKFVAYFFASTHAQSGGMPDFVVRSWIAQMIQLDPDVMQLVKQHFKPGQRASDPVVWKLFESIVSDNHNYVFVLDGFDEYTRLDNVRSQFLQKLKQAFDRTAARVLITSRNETDIESELSPESTDDPRIVILRCKITHEDVDNDISLFSKSLVDEKLPRKDERLRQELAGQLAQKCEGMFLWIKMQQDQLRGGKNARQLQKIVNNMPAGLMKTYERNWNTILDHCPDDRANALAILKWATFAFRPMSVLEITEALIVDHNEGNIVLRRDDLPDDINEDYINGEIIDICGDLVEVRKEETVDHNSAKTLHLIHASVREFLLSGLFQSPTNLNRTEMITVSPVDHSDQHIELAIVCLGHLCNHGTWDQHTDCESPNHQHDFTCYAIRYWNEHVNSGGQNNSELLPLLKSFFRRGNPGFEHWNRYITSLEPTVDEDEEDKSKDVPATPLYYAALLGLSALMEQILLEDKFQLNQVGGIYGTPLQASCFKGHESAFQILLDWGADPNIRGGRFGVPINAALVGRHRDMAEILMRLDLDYTLSDPRGRTLLYTASKHGDYKTAHALLEAGADLTTASRYGWTSLNAAAHSGHLEIVRLLLDKGADLTVVNDNGESPLHSAADRGRYEVVKLLLNRGADASKQDSSGWTPLNSAAHNDHLEIVKSLIKEMDTNIDVPNNDGSTPLNSAAANGNAEIVKFLLARGASIDTADKDSNTPIQLAACDGHLDVVKVLLDNNADMTIVGHLHFTPLNSAAYFGHLEIVRLLLEKGAEIESGSGERNTPLQLATLNGHLDVVKLLLEHNADVATVNEQGRTSLSTAATKGYLEIAEFLLKKGAHLSAVDSSGLTPLHLAVCNGHPNVVKFLLEQGADVTIVDENNSTPVALAARFGHLEIVKLLLQHGADATLTDNNQSTPFTLAARFGHLEVTKLLLEKEVDLNTPDTAIGWTPLASSASNGHLEVVKLLLDQGAETIANSKGWTPLNAASCNGYVEVVKLLLERGADMTPEESGWTPLNIAASNGHVEVVGVLLERGAEMTPNKNGWTPLNSAASDGHVEVVRLLLERGADMTPEETGWTPLISAASNNHVEIVRLLLERGAEMTPAENSWTPLNAAANNGHIEVVRLLLEGGADMAPLKSGWTPLNLAASNGHVEVARLLLERGADMTPEESGRTPLNTACYYGRTGVVRLLLEQNADMTASTLGWTPLIVAADNGHLEIVKILLEKGADATAATRTGWTPLSAAAISGHLEVVETLIHVTADIDSPVPIYGSLWHTFAKQGYLNLLKSGYETHQAEFCRVSPHGLTCLHLAARKGHLETVQYLLNLDLQCPEEDAKGDGLLAHAVCGGSKEVIKILIERDSKTPFESKHWTPLHWACREASAEVVEMLLQAGYRSKLVTLSQPEGKWSPLSVAIFHNNQNMLDQLSASSKALLSVGAEEVQLQSERHVRLPCDACFSDIYGPRFRCNTCPDGIDYCFMCKPFTEGLSTHEGHEWSTIESFVKKD